MINSQSEQLHVVITGSTGRLGREVMREFDEAGISCFGIDSAATPTFRDDGNFVNRRANLTDYGETIDALNGADAVVHLANVPLPGFHPEHVTYSQNVAMDYNVFSAVGLLGVDRLVWMSTANVTANHCGRLYPDTPCDIAANTCEPLFSGEKAQRLFGFESRHTWRS